jgi:hypothetical protein
MSRLHDVLIEHGQLELVLNAQDKEERRRIGVAAEILSDEAQRIAFAHPGMCLTVLPYKRIPDDQSWIREQGDVELSVHPIPNENRRRLGVPYGSKARLILLFLQTEAVKTRSRVVELGNSMNMWMARMGVSVGGTSYRIIEEQAERIEHSIITFSFRRSEGRIRWQDSIIRGSFDPFGRRGQEEFASKTVELSETFFEAIMRHPVPISERAIQLLGERCMPLDIYLWLAYRLHSLEDSIAISWPALFTQFGANTQMLKHFKPRFARDLEMALAAYQDARVELTERGVVLHPSTPPVTPRLKVLTGSKMGTHRS